MPRVAYNLLAVSVVLALVVLFAQTGQTETDVVVLSDANTVTLHLPIVGPTAAYIQRQLLLKSDALPYAAPLYLFLDSPGGSVDDGDKIIETARSLPRPVHTITSFSASMSFIISQMLGTRYILGSGTLMSHRAYGGVEGNIPGSIVSRLRVQLQRFLAIDIAVATRAKMPLDKYQALTSEELWANGPEGVTLGLMDAVVKVRCDKTMRGPAEPIQLVLMGFAVEVVYDKCPLFSQPLAISVGGGGRQPDERIRMLIEQTVLQMSVDKTSFINRKGF